jgi:hypothetical protein
MASDDKKAKTTPAPKKEAPSEKKIEAPAESKSTKAESETSAPPGYSRGEGQKPVSEAYRDNWNMIFGKKTKR